MTFEEFKQDWENDEETVRVRTSGSTGQPKTIFLSKKLMRTSAEATINYFSLPPGAVFHSCVAADYIGGKMMLVRSIISDGRFSSEKPSNRPLSGFNREDHIDLLAVVPSQMLHLLGNKEKLPKIKKIIIGGSTINPDLRKKIADSGLDCYETYGMTETASHIAIRKIDDCTPGPFYPLPWVKIKTDSRGCLVIELPEGETLTTNDLASITPDGGFFISGRIDDVIVTGGKKLNPLQVEEAISLLTRINAPVSSIPDEKWGEMVVAVVETEEAATAVKKTLTRLDLPSWMIPKEVVKVEEIPTLPSGKLDRRRLKKLLSCEG